MVLTVSTANNTASQTVVAYSDGVNVGALPAILLADGVTIWDGKVDAQGTVITGATIPAGGVGFLGWLSAIWSWLVHILAKLPSLGTAGTPSTNVISVQGVVSGTAQPVSGSVTANAGTNLNTSALALESGGNLATIAGLRLAEDQASASGDPGVQLLAIRVTNPAATSGTVGDYEPLQTTGGQLWVTYNTALPAGSNIIGATRQVLGVITDSAGNTLTVKTARATITTATATSIVAAVSTKQIKVLGYSIQSQGSNTPVFNFQDDAGTPAVLSRTWKLDATSVAGLNAVQALPSPLGCGVAPTTATQALMGKMDTTGSVVVEVTYVEV